MALKSAVTSDNLLDELQATLAHGTVARRVETLKRVTDLFINGAVDYSDDQIALFDDVFQCLLVHIEVSAKALLSNRLAPIDTAPPQTIRTLALDDIIEAEGKIGKPLCQRPWFSQGAGIHRGGNRLTSRSGLTEDQSCFPWPFRSHGPRD